MLFARTHTTASSESGWGSDRRQLLNSLFKNVTNVSIPHAIILPLNHQTIKVICCNISERVPNDEPSEASFVQNHIDNYRNKVTLGPHKTLY